MNDPTYLRSTEQLRDFCAQARSEGRVAMDTEFHRERRYYPKLALVQLAVSDSEVLVDPQERLDLEPLDQLMVDGTTTKVLHAGSQDFEIFYLRSKQAPQGVFDTQIAAAMLGLGTQISLAGLVSHLMKVRLKKGASFSDWLKRPLTARQESYALADVKYLLPMHDLLQQKLQSLGREDWVREEFRRFEAAELYEVNRTELFRRVKRFHSLDSRSLAVLQQLAVWREEAARKRDRPRRSVMGDEVMLELARTTPSKANELAATRGVHPREVERSGRAILAAIADGLRVPDEECPVLAKGKPVDRHVELAVSFVQAFLKVYCSQVEIDPSLIASASEVESLVMAHLQGKLEDREFTLLQGWRGELVGEKVLAFLRGEIAVRLDPATVHPILESID